MSNIPTRGNPAPWRAVVKGLNILANSNLANEVASIDFQGSKDESDYSKGVRIGKELTAILTKDIDTALDVLIAIDGKTSKDKLEEATFAELINWIRQVVEDNKDNYMAVSDFLGSLLEDKKQEKKSTSQ